MANNHLTFLGTALTLHAPTFKQPKRARNFGSDFNSVHTGGRLQFFNSGGGSNPLTVLVRSTVTSQRADLHGRITPA